MQQHTLPFFASILDRAWRLYRTHVGTMAQRVMQVQLPIVAVSLAGFMATRGEPDVMLVSTLPPVLFAMHRMLEMLRLQGGFSSLVAGMLGLALLYTLCHAAIVADIVNAARWAAQRQPVVAETPRQPHPYRSLFFASLPVLLIDALWAFGCRDLPDLASLLGILLMPESWPILSFLGPALAQAAFIGVVAVLLYAPVVFVPQYVVIDGCRPIQALRRSAALAIRTKRMTLALILLGYLPVALIILLPYVAGQMAAFFGPMTIWQSIVGLLGTQSLLILLLPVPHIATTLVYLQLRDPV